jgi:hypothetical protein
MWIRDASQRWTLPLSSTASTLRIRRILKPGEVDRFDLRTDGTRVAAGGDTRDLRLQAFNTIVDQECAPRR